MTTEKANALRAIQINRLAAVVAGQVIGVILAVYHKKGFLTGAGYFIAGGIIGGGLGMLATIKREKEILATSEEL